MLVVARMIGGLGSTPAVRFGVLALLVVRAMAVRHVVVVAIHAGTKSGHCW
jgi:hypothetical protein